MEAGEPLKQQIRGIQTGVGGEVLQAPGQIQEPPRRWNQEPGGESQGRSRSRPATPPSQALQLIARVPTTPGSRRAWEVGSGQERITRGKAASSP